MIHLSVTVADTADLLAVPAYAPGALLRWERAAAQAGPYTEGGTVALVALTSLYDVWDAAGDVGTWYRTRVSNAAGSTFSAYSAPFQSGAASWGMSVDQLRTFVASDLPDSALVLLLAAAAEAVAGVVGGVVGVTEYVSGHYSRIVTARLIGTVTSVTEDGAALAAADYRASGYVLTRLATGPNPRTSWGSDVVVVYTPADATAEWQRVQLELVKLDLDFAPGLASQQIGTWAETYRTDVTRDAMRADILASLTPAGGGMLVVGD